MENNYRAAVVSNYSFDNGSTAIICHTEEDAIETLRKIFDEEVKSDTENGHEFESKISSDGRYAKIINYPRCGTSTDVSEWRVAETVFAR